MVQIHQIQFLNLPQPSVREMHARKLNETYGMARRWSHAAADSGLDGLLSAAGSRLLQDLLEAIRRRDALSPGLRGAVVDVAEACSQRSSERYGHLISPAARARALDANRPAETNLTEHSVQLYALAEAIDEVLDLEVVLRRHREILSRG